MFSKDCRAELGRSQKMRSARNLQVKQLSTISNPYGESTSHPPVTSCPALGVFPNPPFAFSVPSCSYLVPGSFLQKPRWFSGPGPDWHKSSVAPGITSGCDAAHTLL